MVFDAGSDFWQLLGAAIVGLGTGGVIVLTRLPVTGLSRSLRGFAICASLWALGDLITSLASTLFWKEIGIAILYSGVVFLPALWWRLAVQWAGERGLRVAFDPVFWTGVPLAFAGVMWLVMLTNPWHGAFLAPVVGGRNVYGPLWYLNAIPSYALIVGALVVEVWALRRGPSGARRQSGSA